MFITTTPKIRTVDKKFVESEENVDRIKTILQLAIDERPISDEDGKFWDGCYPWVSTNEETTDMLQEAYQHFGHDVN